MTNERDTRQNDDAGSDTRTDSYRTTFDWAGPDEPVWTVISAIAAVVGVRRSDLNALDRSIDPDALNALFAPVSDHPRRSGTVSFTHDGCTVTVSAEGWLTVEPPEE